MEEIVSQKKSRKRTFALVMAVMLLVSNLPQAKFASSAEEADYNISLVDGFGSLIASGDASLAVSVSGGDAGVLVETQRQEDGTWKAGLDPELYEYLYEASADGYQSAKGSLSMSLDDLTAVIKLVKIQQLNFMIPGPVKLNSGFGEYRNAAIAESGQAVTYASGNSDVATVDENGTVTKNGSGSTVITASVAGNDIYTEASASYELIFQAESEIIMDTTQVALSVGDTYSERQAYTTRTDSPVISYRSSDTTIAAVDENGIVTIADKLSEDEESASVTITASVSESEDGIWQAAEKSYVITVSKKEQETLDYKNSPAINMYVGQEHEHAATGGSGFGAVEYSSDNPDVAAVNANGTVTAVSAGEAVISIRKLADGQYKEQQLSYRIRVFDNISDLASVYRITGTTKNDSGWYTGDVKVEAAENYSLKRADSSTWSDSLSVTDEGTTTVTFYAKDENKNAITDALTTTDIRLDSKVDKLTVTLAEDKTLYNGEVQLKIAASDKSSGLSKISYVTQIDGEPFESGVCENVNGQDYEGKITIPASGNGNVTVMVTAEDVAGNTMEATPGTFRINTLKPEISIEFADADGSFTRMKEEDDRGYFTDTREAKVTITCDAQSFHKDAATASVFTGAIELKDDSGNMLPQDEVTITEWRKVEEADSRVVYEADITFAGNGNYTWKPGYTDEAGNENSPIRYNDSAAPEKFTIDGIAPKGELEITGVKIQDSETLYKLSNDTMTVSGTFTDDVSGIYSVGYYKSAGMELREEELEALSGETWTEWTENVKSEKDEQFVLYVRIEDYAGNVAYSNTTGIAEDSTAPVITMELDEDYRGYYTDDINAFISVREDGIVQTGIQEITYKVTKYDSNNTGTVIAQNTLYSASSEAYDNAADGTFTIPVRNNDSNKVVISATVTDRVGNENTVTKTIKIDTTLPVVTVTQPDSKSSLYNGAVELTINAEDKTSGLYRISYTASKADGSIYEGTVNETLGTSYEGTITIPADVNGDVIVTVTVEDAAGHKVEAAPQEFRINTVKPKISIEFTDADGSFTREKDGRGYFTDARRAKVTILCDAQSFHAKKATAAVLDQALSLLDNNGNELSKDKVTITDWIKKEGDTEFATAYEATVTFASEGNYTWNPGYTDEAGNTNHQISYNDAKTPVLFTIDTTAPKGSLKVTGAKIQDSATLYHLSDAAMTVSGTFSDAVSSVYSVHYYKNTKDGLTDSDLAKLTEKDWTKWQGEIQSGRDEAFTVYVRIEDYAGNINYIRTAHIVEDCTAPVISIIPAEDNRGYYTSDVKTAIRAEDLGNVQTGVREITYTVTKYDSNDTAAVIAQGTLYTASQTFENSIQKSITVPAQDNDSNKVVISVTATDRVGNKSTASRTIKIDTVKPTVTVTQPDPELALYNQDVQLTINAGDETSGLYGITYVAYRADGTRFEGSVNEKLGMAYEGIITIPSDVNGDVTVKVTVEDVAGKQTQKDIKFRVNTDKPVISIDFGGDDFVREKDTRGYFQTGRTATVAITCDSYSFDGEAAAKSILDQAIRATDVNGNEINLQAVSITEWTTVEGADDFEDRHSATVTFAQEGNYVWTPDYTDRAGNANAQIQYGTSATPQRFTIDYTKPTGKVTVEDLGTWDSLLDSIHFGLTSNVAKQVSGECRDVISPIFGFTYYKTSDPEAKTAQELDRITEWKDFQTFTSAENEQMTVYVRVEDYAGNVRYFGTNGIIFDNVLPNIAISIPAGTNGIHAGNVVTGISVEDPVWGGTAAGIQSVDYEVYNQGALTMQGNLYQDSNETPSVSDIMRRLNQSITVLAEENNSNNVEIRIIATDHAGNKSTASESLCIDMTVPVISVSYDNNSGDTSFGENTYFNGPRTATIQIRERNFDPGRVMITVTNEDGAVPDVSKWSVTAAEGNGDGETHTATLSFAEDGKYAFHIGCTDMAGNEAAGADYGNSLAPEAFVVDTTLPTIDVVYDNTDFENEIYYKESRTATVTIYEHNFDESRVTMHMEATDNGSAVPAATLSGFSTSGDEHKATISFEQDALYSWSLDYIDMAGNEAESLETQRFYVDTTRPAVTISGIRNHSANNDSGNIGFVLECHDTNFDVFTPVLTMVERDGDSFKVTEVSGSSTNITNGRQFTVENLPEDGIYSLKCTAVDMAGNAFDTIQLIDENGDTVTEERTAGQDLISFSVNREGSAFGLDGFTEKLVNDYYVQSAEQDVCILETNTDSLEAYTVELNGEKLEEGSDYTVKLAHDEDSWYLYTYRISETLFDEEGEYNIVVQSVDKTKTTAYSDVKNLNLSFVVDKTPPVVTLSGLSSNGRYQTAEQSVTAIPADDGGKVQSVRVIVLDSGGEPLKSDSGENISTRFDMSGEDLDEYLSANNGQVLFTVPEGFYMTVQVICKDYAVDSFGNTNESVGEYTNVTVSPSSFVIFLANKQLLFAIGCIVGAGVIGAAAFVIIRVKKKKVK